MVLSVRIARHGDNSNVAGRVANPAQFRQTALSMCQELRISWAYLTAWASLNGDSTIRFIVPSRLMKMWVGKLASGYDCPVSVSIGSERIGKVVWFNSAKFSASDPGSRLLIASNTTPSGWSTSYAACVSGISARQGGHHEPQKLIQTGCPRYSDSVCFVPSVSGTAKSGAIVPTAGSAL